MLDPLRRLIDAVPRATLAEIIFEMLAAEPAKRRPGRPRKPSRPRGRPRSRPPATAPIPARRRPRLGRRRERKGAPRPSRPRKRLWAKAAALSDAPWKLVAERLGINPAVAVDAYRHHRLPPGVSVEAAAAFN